MTEVAANPLVAPRIDSTRWYSGLGLVEEINGTVAGIESGSWIDTTIGGVATSLDALATVLDPLGSMLSWGVGWLLEHVKPLSDALDWLAGEPDQITAYAQTWRNVAAQSAGAAADLQTAMSAQLVGWEGASARAYQEHVTGQIRAMGGLARAATGIASLVEGAGLLVALTREMVRDLIADFVSVLAVRLPLWLAETGVTLGAATPLVVSQVGSLVAKWAARIGRLVSALINSLRHLVPLLGRLEGLMDELTRLLHRAARTDPTAADSPTAGGTVTPFGSPGLEPMGRRSDWSDPTVHPQPPPPSEAQLLAGDPVYHRPTSTAIGYDSATMNNFDMVGPIPGHHDVVVHGERNGMFRPGLLGADGGDHPSGYTHPQQIADAIRANPHYDGGPVRLVACHTGTVDPQAGVPPAAQQVADALGVPVTAPTDAVGVDRYGPVGQTPMIRGDGEWKTFYPKSGR
ncbi:WXG100 family type VII secretion target [Micromonospora sp. NBC_01739]|uniref:WXG100 family type VII secretion target n=1 Tax=Micromonospora sp. NBC_01739 TaxID=2975985 RepID=UPI002E107E2F|nr:WXG100 family type VII secretion target [Micromonospora sp. NBC_01739]